MTPDARAALIEVFCSVQGEGRHVGQAMGFVRVATCPIRCLYCDTPDSYAASGTLAVGAARVPNPVAAGRAAELVDGVCQESPWESSSPRHRSPVSLTGGEPLVFPDFAHAIGRALQALGRPLHLETAALHPEALGRVLPVLTHVSADWKLPGTLRQGDFREQHEQCIGMALDAGVSVDAKLVLTPDVVLGDVVDAARRLARLGAAGGDLCVVVQPVTPFGAVTSGLDGESLAQLVRPVSESGLRYLVLPQTHKQLALP